MEEGANMYKIKVYENISSAHQLREYKGKCENLHGHNWKIEVVFQGGELDSTGMLIDFKVAKELLKELAQKLDHKVLNDISPFDIVNPTAENMAGYIHKELGDALNVPGCRVYSVSVWETDTNCAIYLED